MTIIVKISPEVMIKSRPVRKRTIQLLTQNIAIFLKEYKEKIKILPTWDRITIEFRKDILEKENNEIIKILSFIPGIYSFYNVIEGNLTNLDNLYLETKNLFLEKISNKTFVVRVHRTGKHDFSSIDAEKYLGGLFLKNSINAKVKLENSDIIINIDIKEDKYFVIQNRYNGIGGYPVSFQGKVLSLISGGFDSGVSTYLSMRRGCEVDFLFFNLGGTAHELGVKQVAHYLWKTFSKNYKAKFITINFEEIIKELLTKIDHKYRGIILKRLMLKCASNIGETSHYALVKGDSLGQVSSQTLINMSVIDKSSSMLVLRPLITYDKQEIIDITKKIGTYDFACNMPEYCGVISDKPATKSEEYKIIEEEKNIDITTIQKAINNKKIEKIEDVLNTELGDLEMGIEMSYLPGNDEVIIDIREPEKITKSPLEYSGINIINIPFFDINHKFPTLDKNKNYLFYCDKGVLSKLHALYLKEKGFNNIKIFRPLKKENNCKI
nr:tRNA 4-thiouridine(8) synthase ThiI [Candidatus Gracilibacteria bacterium]